MRLKYKFEVNKQIQKQIDERTDMAALAGATKFHDIEIREEVMPAMSGLMEKRVDKYEPYDYGVEGFEKKAGTKVTLTKGTHTGKVQTHSPVLQKLFYGRSFIHATKEDHIDYDIDMGGEHSYRNIHGENPRENKNAQPRWTEVIMNGPSFRNEIVNECAKVFNEGVYKK